MQRGRESLRQGGFAAALECFTQLLAVEPGNLDALAGRGRALGHLGRHCEAAQCFASVLAVRPDHLECLGNQGVALHKLGRNTEALTYFDRVLALIPAHPDALAHRGFVLQAVGRFEEALDSLDRALRVNPRSLTAQHARGMTLERLGRYEQALKQFGAVLAQDPRHVDAWSSRGVVLGRLNRHREARAAYVRALEIAPGNVDVLFNLSFLQLTEGDLVAGFRGQALRWTARLPRLDARTDRPIWLGQPALSGKTILLHHEQGFGDTIQFVRFAPLVAAQAAAVLLRVPDPLIRLLSRLPDLQVISEHQPLPPHDLHCPLMCLPVPLGTTQDTIPAPRSYLQASPEDIARWKQRLGPITRPRIGLVWRGHTQYALAAQRDIPFEDLMPLLTLPAELISLQKEVPAKDRAALEASGIARHGESLTDFADTAGLIQNLDLVITTDTSVAHLAGALGKLSYILLHHVPCWRWRRGREDSPWYPTVQVFRQQTPGDWPGVIADVRAAAARLCQLHIGSAKERHP